MSRITMLAAAAAMLALGAGAAQAGNQATIEQSGPGPLGQAEQAEMREMMDWMKGMFGELGMSMDDFMTSESMPPAGDGSTIHLEQTSPGTNVLRHKDANGNSATIIQSP